MKEDKLYDNLLTEIRKKVPNKTKLTNTLVDILHIEREAVYRRLRGDVPFSFTEVATISQVFGISVDDIIGARTEKSRPFQLRLIEYSNPLEEDFAMVGQLVEMLRMSRNDLTTEICIASNVIPQALYLEYPYISRFYLFKWMYMYGSGGAARHFSDVTPAKGLENVQKDFAKECRMVKKTCFILDYQMFSYFLNDISYFKSIKLITPDEVNLIKQELMGLVEQINRVATAGSFGGDNKLNIYVSSINFDTNYCYMETAFCHLSIIKAFTLNTVASVDENNFQRFKKWINSYKRLSTLISESGEMQRIQFLDHQRKLIEAI